MTTTEQVTAPTSVWELIDTIGGRKLANHLGGIAFTTVHAWKERGKIPPMHWVAIVQFCEELNIPGVNFAALALWHAPKNDGPTG